MKFLQLNLKDLSKGFIMAVLTAASASLLIIIAGDPAHPEMVAHLPTFAELKVIGIGSVSVGLIYLFKNFLTNSQDQFLTKEPK